MSPKGTLVTIQCQICGRSRTGNKSDMVKTSICKNPACKSELFRRIQAKRGSTTTNRPLRLLVCSVCHTTFARKRRGVILTCCKKCTAQLVLWSRNSLDPTSKRKKPKALQGVIIPDPFETIYD